MLKLQRENFGFGSKREGRYYDATLEETRRKRERRKLGAFSFVEQGTYMKKGDMIRKKHTLELLDSGATPLAQITSAMTSSGSTPISAAPSNAGVARILNKTVKVKPPDPIPEVEWWDAPLLPVDQKAYLRRPAIPDPPKAGPETGPSVTADAAVKEADFAVSEKDLQLRRITDLVQHPLAVKNDYIEKVNNTPAKIMLTDREKRKQARNRRLEKEKDKREKIKLGLAEPPPPKITMKNFMQILTKDAVADPSKTEAAVKKMIDARQMKHLHHNLDRKLTRQQKNDKFRAKLNRDLNDECRAALFRIETLICPTHRYLSSRLIFAIASKSMSTPSNSISPASASSQTNRCPRRSRHWCWSRAGLGLSRSTRSCFSAALSGPSRGRG
jgi:U4/U6 small nuclear ribonucleoprotein PRP3